MKRSALSLIALVLLLTCVLAVPASAAEPAEEITVSPRFVDIRMISTSIDVNSSGKASCYTFVDTANSSYTINISMSLQRYKNGGWTNVKTWTTSGTGEVSLDKSYYVSSGYYYRTAVAATVYTSGGTYVETGYGYSQNDYY